MVKSADLHEKNYIIFSSWYTTKNMTLFSSLVDFISCHGSLVRPLALPCLACCGSSRAFFSRTYFKHLSSLSLYFRGTGAWHQNSFRIIALWWRIITCKITSRAYFSSVLEISPALTPNFEVSLTANCICVSKSCNSWIHNFIGALLCKVSKFQHNNNIKI